MSSIEITNEQLVIRFSEQEYAAIGNGKERYILAAWMIFIQSKPRTIPVVKSANILRDGANNMGIIVRMYYNTYGYYKVELVQQFLAGSYSEEYAKQLSDTIRSFK